MIKLIASDMDGTLLDPNQDVPEETYELIHALREKGIHFAASSGRRHDALRKYFGPVADEIDYVAANGAQVYVDGVLIDQETYSPVALRRLREVVRMFDMLHLAVFDSSTTYLLSDAFKYKREIDKELPNPIRVDALPAPDVNIIKASVYCEDNPLDMAYVLTRELGEDFVFAPSGHQWIDVMQRGVSKATGIRQVIEAHGISPDEVMAFGDSMNDYEILRMVGDGVAMGNGRYAIRQIANRVIGTNAEHSVQNELRKVLDSLS